MNTKQLMILVGVVVILWVAFVLLDRSAVPTADNEMFIDVDTTAITEMEVMNGGTTLTLTKRDDGWYITNPIDYRANRQYITDLLEKLSEMNVESEVTHNQDRWPEFEVDTAGVALTVRQGSDETRVVLGKAAESYKQSYGRYADGETVYLLNGTYKMVLSRTVENWRDKAIFPHPQHMVRSMTTDQWSLMRDDEGTWTMTVKGSEVPVKQPDAGRIQSQIARLRTSGFPTEDELATVDFTSPADGMMQLGLDDGTRADLSFWLDPDNERRFYVRYGDANVTYILYEGIYNQLFKSVDDLKMAEQPAMEGAPAEG